MKKPNPIRFTTIAVLILLAAMSRLLVFKFATNAETPASVVSWLINFAPIGAMALFAGASYGLRLSAFIVPILAVWISDWFINLAYTGVFNPFYKGFYWQYLAYGSIAILGSVALKKVTPLRVIGSGLFASAAFFVISNFGVWATGTRYPMNFSGLINCFVQGIPFIKGTIASNLIFSSLLFGAFELAKRQFPVLNLRDRQPEGAVA